MTPSDSACENAHKPRALEQASCYRCTTLQWAPSPSPAFEQSEDVFVVPDFDPLTAAAFEAADFVFRPTDALAPPAADEALVTTMTAAAVRAMPRGGP
jgi:hypothetical protein